MATLLATLAIFGCVMLAMALGVMIQGRRLRGSCGGTGQDCSCSPLAARAHFWSSSTMYSRVIELFLCRPIACTSSIEYPASDSAVRPERFVAG